MTKAGGSAPRGTPNDKDGEDYNPGHTSNT